MDTTNSIIGYYGAADPSDPPQDRELELQTALKAELAKNVLMVEAAIPPTRGDLRMPLFLLVLSLAFSAFSLGFSLKNYNVKMEALFFQPTPLFNTEALLIEALKKRSDIEISKRDRMIAEYQRRAALREDVLKVLAPKTVSAAQERTETAQDKLPFTPAINLEELRREAAMEALYAHRLEQALTLVSRNLAAADMEGAERTLVDLRKSLGRRDPLISEMAQASLDVAAALSSSIAVMKAAGETPKIVYQADPQQEKALKRVRAENIALLDRILVLESRRAPTAVTQPASVSGPSGAFLGTIALASGDRILVDLAQGARPLVGDRAEIYGTDAGGASVLLAEAIVSSLRDGTAELRVSISQSNSTARPRVRDTVYLTQR